MVTNFPNIFSRVEDITNLKFELQYFPNDYGTTNPNGNMGANINRNDLDYINMAKAWDLTTGQGTTIGISDARIKPDDPDFISKISFINPTFSQNWAYDSNNAVTFHGTQTAGIAAAQGNNNYGSTGVCYDCSIVGTGYGDYNNLLVLAQQGIKVINISWGSFYYVESLQNVVDEIINDYKTVLVASGGNLPSHQTVNDFRCELGHWDNGLNSFVPNYQGVLYFYPASYKGVISVSGIGHFYNANDPAVFEGHSPLGIDVASFIKDSFSPNVDVTDVNNPIGLKYHGWGSYCTNPYGVTYNVSPQGIVWTYTFNEKIDILAPGFTNFNFPKFAEENGFINYYLGGGTSSAAPYVSGTAALMININSCLEPSEVEDILQLTSRDVVNVPINQNFTDVIGSGCLNAGNSVEFVNEAKKNNGLAIISNHIFNRFEFDLQKINHDLEIKNVTFKENNKSNFVAKNQIHLLPNTNLSPGINGGVHLSINPSIDPICNNLITPILKNRETDSKKESYLDNKIKLSPNPNKGSFILYNLIDGFSTLEDVNIYIFDLNGRILYTKKLLENEFSECKIDNSEIQNGVYIVKIVSNRNEKSLKFIKN